MGTSGNNSSPRLAWFFIIFFILVIITQVFLGFVYNTSSTPAALILFNAFITLITFALALFQIFLGGMQAFFSSLHIPGLTTFLRRRAPFIVFSLILVVSLSFNIYLVIPKTHADGTSGKATPTATPTITPTASPNSSTGVIYVGSSDHSIYALRASDGSLLWQYKTGGEVNAGIIVVNGTVYTSSHDHSIYALRASDGSFLWKYQTKAIVYATPKVVGSTVYVGSSDSYVYALDANSGSLLWKYQTGNGISSATTAANGVVYVGSFDDFIYALQASNGRVLWKYSFGGAVLGIPAVGP